MTSAEAGALGPRGGQPLMPRPDGDDADGLTVRGGTATRVDLEDLHRVGADLVHAGEALARASRELAGLTADPGLVATGYAAPASLAAVGSAVTAAVAGQQGLLAAGARVALLGDRVRLAAVRYGEVDAAVDTLLDGVDPVVRGAAGVLGALGAVSPLLRESRSVEVGPATSPVRVAPPRGLVDLLAMGPVAGGDREPAHATVRVDRIVGPDGRRASVVAVPGTQDWGSRPGTNPFDLTGDVHLMAGRDTAAMHGVLSAMERSGVLRGEPVLLVGHSQGGLVAARLAADPEVRARYAVTHVVTSGAPVAGFEIPASVRVLSVEHTDDLVPMLDGRRNTAHDGWLTVSRRTGRPEWPSGAHSRGEYLRTAALVDASRDPALREWRRGASVFFDGEGVEAVAVEVTCSRAPP